MSRSADEDLRDAYLQRALSHEQVLEYERRLARQTPLGWYQLADRIHSYLYLLVDRHLIEDQLALVLAARQWDVGHFLEDHSARGAIYEDAAAAFSNGDHARCLTLLDTALPAADVPWVFWDDLRALQRWLIASDHVRQQPIDLSDRVQQLRVFTAKYVHQLARTIADEKGHLFAVRLREMVEQSLRETSRLPVAAVPSLDENPIRTAERPRA